MTPFEFIILMLIYCFCYGYALTILKIDDEDWGDKTTHVIVSAFIAFYVPIIIGIQIANKLND